MFIIRWTCRRHERDPLEPLLTCRWFRGLGSLGFLMRRCFVICRMNVSVSCLRLVPLIGYWLLMWKLNDRYRWVLSCYMNFDNSGIHTTKSHNYLRWVLWNCARGKTNQRIRFCNFGSLVVNWPLTEFCKRITSAWSSTAGSINKRHSRALSKQRSPAATGESEAFSENPSITQTHNWNILQRVSYLSLVLF